MRLRFLGYPGIQDAEGNPRSVPSRTVLHLLAYLWIHRDAPQPRERLLALFWPEADTDKAQSNLRSALHYLRKALAADSDPNAFLEVDRATIRFRPDAPVWVDVDAFEAGITQAEAANDPNERVSELEAACRLYRGPFLDGGYAEWIFEERERMRGRYLKAVHELIRSLARTRAYEAALEWTVHALAERPLQEAIYRQQMALNYARGDRDAALQAYERCRAKLGAELDVAPDQTTDALRQRFTDDAGPRDLADIVGWSLELPGNLPSARSPLIGRDDKVEAIRVQLQTGRLVTVTGLGGAGKTRLALEVARMCRPSFRDGAWLVDLTSVHNAAEVPHAVADALAVAPERRDPLDAVAKWLERRQALLVLDNSEHVRAACAETIEKLLGRCPHLRALVTSRERLGLVGEVVRSVPPLELPEKSAREDVERADAARLFVERARRQLEGFRVTRDNAPAIARICSRLGGLPLGIELVAAWVRALPVEEIAEEIDDDFDVDAPSHPYHDLPHRQRSLRATFAHSWSLLSEPEREAMERLSVFRSPFGRTAADRVADASLSTLASLVDKSLLSAIEPGRYRMHPLIRQYAQERLAHPPEREQQARRAHGAYIAEVLEQQELALKGANQRQALENIQDIWDDIRAMWKTAVEWKEWSWIERMLDALFFFCEIRSRFREAKRLLETALAAVETSATSTGRRTLKGRLQLRLGRLFSLLGQPETAEPLLRDGLSIARDGGDRTETASGLNWLGLHLLVGSDPQAARAPLEEAMTIRREIGDRQGMAVSLDNLGHLELIQENLESSHKLYQQSLAIRREIGDKHRIAISLNSMGNVERKRGRLESSREYYEQSLDIKRELGNKRGMASTLNNLGITELCRGDLATSRERYKQSLAIERELGNKYGMAKSLNNLGNVEDSLGNLAASRECHEASLALKRELGNKRGVAASLLGLGYVELSCGNYKNSCEYFHQGLSLHRDISGSCAIAEGVIGLASALCADGQTADAARLQGIVTASIEQGDAVLEPEDQALYDETAEELRKALGMAGYREAFEAGRSMPFEEAIALAHCDDVEVTS